MLKGTLMSSISWSVTKTWKSLDCKYMTNPLLWLSIGVRTTTGKWKATSSKSRRRKTSWRQWRPRTPERWKRCCTIATWFWTSKRTTKKKCKSLSRKLRLLWTKSSMRQKRNWRLGSRKWMKLRRVSSARRQSSTTRLRRSFNCLSGETSAENYSIR